MSSGLDNIAAIFSAVLGDKSALTSTLQTVLRKEAIRRYILDPSDINAEAAPNITYGEWHEALDTIQQIVDEARKKEF